MRKLIFPTLPRKRLSKHQIELIDYLIEKEKTLQSENSNFNGYIPIATVYKDLGLNYRNLIDIINRLRNVSLIKKRMVPHKSFNNQNGGRRYNVEIKLDTFALACMPAKYLKESKSSRLQNNFLQIAKTKDFKYGTGIVREIFGGFNK